MPNFLLLQTTLYTSVFQPFSSLAHIELITTPFDTQKNIYYICLSDKKLSTAIVLAVAIFYLIIQGETVSTSD